MGAGQLGPKLASNPEALSRDRGASSHPGADPLLRVPGSQADLPHGGDGHAGRSQLNISEKPTYVGLDTRYASTDSLSHPLGGLSHRTHKCSSGSDCLRSADTWSGRGILHSQGPQAQVGGGACATTMPALTFVQRAAELTTTKSGPPAQGGGRACHPGLRVGAGSASAGERASGRGCCGGTRGPLSTRLLGSCLSLPPDSPPGSV